MDMNLVFDWSTIGALAIPALAGFAVLLTAVFTKSVKTCLAMSVAGVLGSAAYTMSMWGVTKTGFSGMVIIDNFTNVLYLIILAGSLLTLFISYELLEERRATKGEFLALILFSTFGLMAMVSAGDLMMIFLGLETASIALYILTGFRREDVYSLEAALKYFILGSFASGFLLFGFAFLYGATGTTHLPSMVAFFQTADLVSNYYLMLAFGLMTIGFGFKLALVPFHMWTPDVYEGAPTQVTAFMSTGVKAAGFAVLIRIFFFSSYSYFPEMQNLFWLLAVLTMSLGNIVALSQTNIKRMLAYSSIAHAGYMLVAFTAGSAAAVGGILFYLATYTVMNLGAFGVVTYLESKDKTIHTIESFSGLGFQRPLLAAAMAIFMFSLAGIPPFAGFFAKFYALKAALDAGFVWLVVIAVLNSVVSVYFYIRVVLNMYMKESTEDFSIFYGKTTTTVAISLSVIIVLIMGIFPTLFLGFAGIR